MSRTYAAWIAARYPTREAAQGACSRATAAMVEAFPELQRVAGWALTAERGQVEHWWCMAPDGAVVDPTSAQWSCGVAEYIPFAAGDVVRVGRCLYCGEHIEAPVRSLSEMVGAPTFCDAECGAAAVEAMS